MAEHTYSPLSQDDFNSPAHQHLIQRLADAGEDAIFSRFLTQVIDAQSAKEMFTPTDTLLTPSGAKQTESVKTLQKLPHFEGATILKEGVLDADFILDKQAAKNARQNAIPDQPDEPPSHIAQRERTEFMQKNGLLISGEDIILYAPHSQSGLNKGQPLNNIYLSLHHDGPGGQWRCQVGAAQGAELKVKPEVDGQRTKEEILETYRQEAIYQVAFGIIGQQMTARMNGQQSPDMPPLAVVSNYLSNAGGFESNAKMIEQRAKALQDLEDQGIPPKELQACITKICAGNEQTKALGTQICAKLAQTEPLPCVFNQAGMNLDRQISVNQDETKLFKKLETIIEAKRESGVPDTIAEALLKDLKHSQRLLTHPVFRPISAVLGALRTIPILLGVEMGNHELDREARKTVLLERLGVVAPSGCKSAKDREGVIRLLANAYQSAIQWSGRVPLPIGSMASIIQQMPRLRGIVNIYRSITGRAQIDGSDDAVNAQQSMNREFVKAYRSGAAQFVAHANTKFASGIKNNGWLLGLSMRSLINAECKRQDGRLKAKENSLAGNLKQQQTSGSQSDQKEVQDARVKAKAQRSRNTLVQTKQSHKLAEGNNDYKPGDKAVKKRQKLNAEKISSFSGKVITAETPATERTIGLNGAQNNLQAQSLNSHALTHSESRSPEKADSKKTKLH